MLNLYLNQSKILFPLNNSNCDFNKLGVVAPNLLNPNRALIYQSDTLVTSVKYAGSSSILSQANGISNIFTNKLTNINGIVSLGGNYQNAHLYIPTTNTLDSKNRLCYISQKSNSQLLVKEYYDPRGSKFSSLFSILYDRVYAANSFTFNGKSFIVDLKNINIFINIVNDIFTDHANGKFMLYKYDQPEKIFVKGNYYYYDTAYWIDNSCIGFPNSKVEDSSIKESLEKVLGYILSKDKIIIDGMEIDIKKLI